MKIQDQCCTIAQAKRLHELGVVQESIFWAKCNEEQEVIVDAHSKMLTEQYFPTMNKYFAAFSVGELVAMNENVHGISYSDKEKQFYSGYASDHNVVYYQNFAEACAAKLINAIEKEWVTLEEVNSRLIA